MYTESGIWMLWGGYNGVTSSELQSVLDYIYQGEVQVYQEDLDRFLAVAERFQLEGLMNFTDVYKQEEDLETLEEILPPRPTQSVEEWGGYSPVNRSRAVKTKKKPKVLIDNGVAAEIETKIADNFLKEADGTFSCKLCGKFGVKQKINMKNHVETHIKGLSFPCEHCGKTFRYVLTFIVLFKIHSYYSSTNSFQFGLQSFQTVTTLRQA